LVTHASANLLAILGCPVEQALGRPIEAVLGAEACCALLGNGLSDGTAVSHVHVISGPNGGALHLHAYRSGPHVCVDIEPTRSTAKGTPFTTTQSILESFSLAANQIDLCRLAVRGLKCATGYDRAMAYRFAGDGHGEVIAEAVEAGFEPYLGLRYPAADVPAQARQLYLRHRVGAVADAAYVPVLLLAARSGDAGAPLDLTRSTLRSVSPVHRAYMQNMGTAASLTVGLASGDRLWGMLVCHHSVPRVAGPDLRAVAEMIGQVVSL
jgi:light-regulated signal transduction histidine kinase (bacteriophytochrome)